MKRITPKMVREAAERNGITLVSGTFGRTNGVCSGCALTALYVDGGGDGPPSAGEAFSVGTNYGFRVRDWATDEFGSEYVDGFLTGFDTFGETQSDGRFDEGYADGTRCREELLCNA